MAGSMTADIETERVGTTFKVFRIAIPLVLIGIMVAVLTTVSNEDLLWLIDRLQGEWRLWAIPGLIVVGALLTAVGFPGTIVSLTAGATFGFFGGFPCALASAFCAACLTVAAGRWFGHPPQEDQDYGDGEDLRLIERVRLAIGSADWRFVSLLRLSPILPYAMVNFLLGSWRVPWPSIIAGTALGLLPGTAAHVYLAAAGRRLLEGGALHPIEWVLLGVGVLSIPLTAWMFMRLVKRRGKGAQATPE